MFQSKKGTEDNVLTMCDFGYLKISYRSDLNKVAQRIVVLFQST